MANPTIKILAFAGSYRLESFNKKLIRVAAKSVEQAGAEVTLIDLKDYPLPIFDQDLEDRDGLPENAKVMKQLFIDHHGLLIASPEYNSSITGLLKNTIDWVSRPAPGEGSLACFDKKVAGLFSASPGALGGLRSLGHLRSILENIRVMVIPDQLAVPKANEAFDGNGRLKDSKQQANVDRIGAELVRVLTKLKN